MTTKQAVALRYASMVERGAIGGEVPFDHEIADLLRNLDEALRAATCYVETFTPNGCSERPPMWALNEHSELSPERIAAHCRKVLAIGSAA